MTDQERPLQDQEQDPAGSTPPAPTTETAPRDHRRAIVLVVVVAFVALLVVKLVADGSQTADLPASDDPAAQATITSVRNDAVADFETARESGKPIFVLFHSMSCAPCEEISLVADQVAPDYASDVVFVNAITDEPSGRELAGDFTFQYIPTAFFLSPGGAEVVDSYTGAMDETQMRGYLDALVAAQ